MTRGVGGMEGIVRRGRIIVHGQCRMAAVRGTAATGDTVRPTIDHRCRRIGRDIVVPATASRVIVRVVQVTGTPGIALEGRSPGLRRDIDPAARLRIVQELVPGMGIVQEQVLEVLETEIDQEVVRVVAVRLSRDRVEDRRRNLVRRNRTVLRRSLVLRSRAVPVRNLVLRSRASLRNSLGLQGERHRGRDQRRTGGRAANRTRLCWW